MLGPEAGIRAEPGHVRQAPARALAAVVALAAVAGALGGALATAGLSHFVGDDAPRRAPAIGALEASIARIDADILALKASVEHTSKLGMSQFNKTSDRLDKIEKAQAEPAAKLAKLSEAVDKLRAAPPAAPASRRRGAGWRRRKSPARSRRPRRPRAPVPAARAQGRSGHGCRRSRAGCCATSPMAAR